MGPADFILDLVDHVDLTAPRPPSPGVCGTYFLVNFIAQKLKSKHFSLFRGCFGGTRGNIFHIFRALDLPDLLTLPEFLDL